MDPDETLPPPEAPPTIPAPPFKEGSFVLELEVVPLADWQGFSSSDLDE